MQASREALQQALGAVGGLHSALEAAAALAQRSLAAAAAHARTAQHAANEVPSQPRIFAVNKRVMEKLLMLSTSWGF